MIKNYLAKIFEGDKNWNKIFFMFIKNEINYFQAFKIIFAVTQQ